METGASGRPQVGKIREIVRKNYERGVAHGRQQERQENAAVHPRQVLLRTASGMLEQMREQMAQIPNSERAEHAFKEAEAILRDATGIGEHG